MTEHTIADHLQRGRETAIRCRCGWVGHWYTVYNHAVRQFDMHRENHR